MAVFEEGRYELKKAWTITYDSGVSLEPLYYWIIDFMRTKGMKIFKVFDWYSFSYRSQEWEAQQRKWNSVFQNANSLLSQLGQIIKSLVAMKKDHQRIKEALGYHKDSKGKPSDMVLKGIWMDNVDPQSGPASFSQATKNLQFYSARDWFIKVKDLKEIDEIPTNDRIKGYLKRKYKEYEVWKKHWKNSLEEMDEILEERVKASEGTVKTYKQWASPLLRDMKALSQKQDLFDPDLINIGSSVFSQLKLWAYAETGKFVSLVEVNFTIRGTSPNAIVKTTVEFKPDIWLKDAFDRKVKEYQKDPVEEWINNMMLDYEYGTKRKQAEEMEKKSSTIIGQIFNSFKKNTKKPEKEKPIAKKTRIWDNEPDFKAAKATALDKAWDTYDTIKKSFNMMAWPVTRTF